MANTLANPLSGGNPLNSLSSGITNLALGALGSWVLHGAQAALQETASVIDQTTAPRLESTWFSSTYWRVVGLAAVLTLPFLFAAAVQALLRSDLTLLVRAAFGYLPLAMLGVSIAAPITLMLLSVTDEMSSVVAGAGSGGGAHFLRQTATVIVGLSVLARSPFLGFAIGLMTLAAALALALEMLIREAAVYVVVLMLPLAFAALVWPARRTWAVRLVELLISLILSKFVIVAVLSLAGAADGATGALTITRLLTAMALVMLSTFAPWVLLRLLPFTELAAGAGGALRAEVPRLSNIPRDAMKAADGAAAWAEGLMQRLRSPSSDKSDGSDSGASDSGGAQVSGARYTPADPDAGGIALLGRGSGSSDGSDGSGGSNGSGGEQAAPVSGGRPAARDPLPGLSRPWQRANGTVEVSLGRNGTGLASDPQPAMPDGTSSLGSPEDVPPIQPPEDEPALRPPDDEPVLLPPRTSDEGHL